MNLRVPFIKDTNPFYLILLIFSFCVFVLLLADISRPEEYSGIWILPLVYIVSLLLIIAGSRRAALYKVIIIAIYFLRMVITPLVMMLGQYGSVISSENFSNSISIAIFLMSYENIVVFIFLDYISRKDFLNSRKELKNINYDSHTLKKPSKKLKVGICILIFFALSILAKDPSISKHTFLYILDSESTYYALSETTKGIGTLNMFVQILSSIFKIIQIILPPFILYYILKIRVRAIRVQLALILTVLVCLVATEDRIDALLAGLAFLLTLRTVLGYKFEKKSMAILGAICIVCFVGLAIKGGAFSDSSVNNDKSSATIQAYFSGIPTVATGIDYVEHKSDNIYFLQAFPDAISKVPFLTYAINLFGGIKIQNSNQLFNQYICNITGYNIGQILPTTIVGYSYFGLLFAPIFPCLLVMLARYYWKKIFIQNDLILRNLYFWITISVSLCPVVMSGLLIVGKLSWFYFSYWFVKILNK